MTNRATENDSIGNRDSMIEVKEEVKLLPVPLTREERLELGENLAQAMASIDQKTIELKAKQADIKADIEKLQESAHADAAVLRAGAREREVRCEVQRNY